MTHTYRDTMIPVILGATLRARLTADGLFRRLHVRSYVMDERYHPALLLTPTLRFRRLRQQTGYADLILADIIRLAEDYPDKLPVLIATTPFYQNLLREHSALLERYYIISDPSLSFLAGASSDTAPHLMRGERT